VFDLDRIDAAARRQKTEPHVGDEDRTAHAQVEAGTHRCERVGLVSAARDWASWFLSQGWVTIPVGYRDKAPLWKDWQAGTLEVAKQAFEKNFPESTPVNVGIVLGAASGGLVDVDLDCPEALELAPIFLPPTITFGRDSTRASHWLYISAIDTEKFQDPLRTRKKGDEVAAGKAMLVEIRSTGCQTVFPGSTHVSGEAINFDTDPTKTRPSEVSSESLRVAVEQLAGACLLARYWPPGGRHDAQLALAGALLADGWSEPRATELLCAVCRVNGSEERSKRAYTVSHTAEKIRAGETVTGWKQLEAHFEKKVLKAARKALGRTIDPAASPGLNPATDIANADRLVVRHGSDLRFVFAWNKWLVWTGACWGDGQIEIRKRAEDTVRSIYEEADQAEARGDREYAKFVRRHATNSSSAKGVANMIKLAEPKLAASYKDFDKDTWLLACPNGTVDFRTGEMRESRREDYITKLCPTKFDKTATAPVWTKAVREMMNGDDELYNFLQLGLGYTATGCVKEEVVFLCHGRGKNGKSKMLEAVRFVLGEEHSCSLSSEILMKSQGQHPTGLATLQGKRLSVTIEPEASKQLAEGLIKAISGGDKITARRMREDFWEFPPTHTIWLSVNHKPTVRGGDHGIWRRILPIPFEVRFDPPDSSLPEKFRVEASGILNWLVEGALAYQKLTNSLDNLLPEKSRLFKEIYQDEQDSLHDFVDDCVEHAVGERVDNSTVYKTYQAWCVEEGEEYPLGRKSFSQMLDNKGYPLLKSGTTRWRMNMKLKGAIAAVTQAFRTIPVPPTN
jgi:P4 family phage/plasmid primase-like protien